MDFKELVGSFNTAFSPKADSQLAINCYRARVDSDEGVNPFVLYKSPGMLPYITDLPTNNLGLGYIGGTPESTGSIRGMLELNDHNIVIANSGVYDYVGNIQQFAYSFTSTGNEPVDMAASKVSVLFVDHGTIYRLNGGALTTPSLSFVASSIAFLKNYFVATEKDTNTFWFSRDDGATWDAADFQTAEADANKILAVREIHQQLAFVGTRVTQWFYVIANANKPFAPIDSGVVRSGTISGKTVQTLGEAILWLERHKEGEGRVMMTTAYAGTPVSNRAVENKIREYSKRFSIADAYAMTYEMNGQQFYRLSFPGPDATLEFNKTTGDWEEIQWFDMLTSTVHRHRGLTMVSTAGRILVGDHTNGQIYEMSPDIYHDFGYPLQVIRQTPHVISGNKNVGYDRFDLGVEVGVGLAEPLWLNNYSMTAADFAAALGQAVADSLVDPFQWTMLQNIYDGLPYVPFAIDYPPPDVMTSLGFYPWGDDPRIVMKYSDDGAKSFYDELPRELGRSGTNPLVYWNCLGQGRDRVFRFQFSDPCRLAITTGYFDVQLVAS